MARTHAKKRGILTGLGRPGLQKKPRKKKSKLRTVLGWTGGSLIVIVFGVMIFALGLRMLDPQVGERSFEGDYEVLEIRDDPSSVAPETGAVAVAVIRVRGRSAFVPLRPEQVDMVEVGDTIRVEYTTFPTLGLIRVDEWEKRE
jgi:hypothetical protein